MHRFFVDGTIAADEIKRVSRDFIIVTNNTKIWYYFDSRNHYEFRTHQINFLRFNGHVLRSTLRTQRQSLYWKKRTIQTQLTLHRNIHGKFVFFCT